MSISQNPGLSAAAEPSFLPPAKPDASLAVPKSEVPILPATRVLLLEDDVALKEMVAAYLRGQGCEVVAVPNGVEGVHRVLESEFHAILCDLNMPSLPGDLFYRAIERMRPIYCARFIFMTGFFYDPELLDFVRATGAPVLQKPFALAQTLEAIAQVQQRVGTIL